MPQEQTRRTSTSRDQEDADHATVEQDKDEEAKSIVEEGGAPKSEIDALLDEIDELIEKNSEEFVQDYVQYGGE